jgi:hypothetical protein
MNPILTDFDWAERIAGNPIEAVTTVAPLAFNIFLREI